MNLLLLWDRTPSELVTSLAIVKLMHELKKDHILLIDVKGELRALWDLLRWFRGLSVVYKVCTSPVATLIPEINYRACDACGNCAEVCPTRALVFTPGLKPSILEANCIGCGKCVNACPKGAITANERELGSILEGHWASLPVLYPASKVLIGEILRPLLEGKTIELAHGKPQRYKVFLYPLIYGEVLSKLLSISNMKIIVRRNRKSGIRIEGSHFITVAIGSARIEGAVNITEHDLKRIYRGEIEVVIGELMRKLLEKGVFKAILEMLGPC